MLLQAICKIFTIQCIFVYTCKLYTYKKCRLELYIHAPYFLNTYKTANLWQCTFYLNLCHRCESDTSIYQLFIPAIIWVINTTFSFIPYNEKMKMLNACDVPAFGDENSIGAMLEHCKSLI